MLLGACVDQAVHQETWTSCLLSGPFSGFPALEVRWPSGCGSQKKGTIIPQRWDMNFDGRKIKSGKRRKYKRFH
jgi:hypothetical protein